MNKVHRVTIACSFLRRHVLLLASAILFVVGFAIQFSIELYNAPNNTAARVQLNYLALESQSELKAKQLESYLMANSESLNSLHFLDSLLHQNEFSGNLVVEYDDSICWFNNASILFPHLYSDTSSLVSLPVGIYLQQIFYINDYCFRQFTQLKQSYQISNKYLQSTNISALGIPQVYELNLHNNQSELKIKNQEGNPVLSLTKNNETLLSNKAISLLGAVYFIALAFLIIGGCIGIYRLKFNLFARAIMSMAFMLVLYLVVVFLQFPYVLSLLTIAQAQTYAQSELLPSLMAFMLITLIVLVMGIYISKSFRLKIEAKKLSPLALTASYTVLILYSILLGYVIESLVLNSSFSMHLNRIEAISFGTFIAYICIGLLFLSSFIIQFRLNNALLNFFSKKAIIGINILCLALCIGALVLLGEHNFLLILTSIILINLLHFFLIKLEAQRHNLLYCSVIATVYALLSLILVQGELNSKEFNIRALRAQVLSNMHDSNVEVNLKHIEQHILADTSILDAVDRLDISFIEQYAKHMYFSDMQQQYNVWLTACMPTDELLVKPANDYVSCYCFFDDMLSKSGSLIPESNFYHLNSSNGIVSYFGRIVFPTEDNELTIFIQLEAKIKNEGVGFPELLEDKAQQTASWYNNMSYAIFYDNELVALSGDYPYQYKWQTNDLRSENAIYTITANQYNHTIFAKSGKSYVVVSTPSVAVYQYLFSYPYIFLLFLALALALLFITNPNFRRSLGKLEFSGRIQFAILGTVALALLVISAATISYNIFEYQKTHRHDLKEKVDIISKELSFRLENTSSSADINIEQTWSELADWSNVFRTDINLYNLDGLLIASSRPTVFELGLCTPFMHADAFRELTNNTYSKYVQKETIGNLSFLSAYEPILNENGEVLCYLNLPYFLHTLELRQAILNFVVVLINLSFLLLFLSIFVALALSNRITQPLASIRKSLREMSIDKKNKPITYKANDEIGALVEEYNNKLKDLESSTQLLAQTQRELAWKEMAKQVAHEIKNPLTPMKLQVQLLQRAKLSGNEEAYSQMFDKVTSTLIEQINRLSGIANSFSQFARMPDPQPEQTNLSALVESVISLFNHEEKCNIVFASNLTSPAHVFVDKEQASRAIINLIKNAQQATPPERNSIIKIELQTQENKALLKICDNGTGVPEDIKHKLFEPNFTTKSSGMGLGLAIVKRVIESAKGKVWFKSCEGKGSCFYIELPLHLNSKSS